MASLKYWLWLAQLRGVSRSQKILLLQHFHSPEEIYYAQEPELQPLRAELPRNIPELLEEKSLEEAEKILEDCQRLQIGIMTIDDAIYPDRLRNIYDAPLLLYYRGHLPELEEEPVISVVGTRNASPYGMDTGEKMGYGLAKHGAVVASGLARGIDTAAIRGALRAGGVTVGVLGGGIDRIYPKENQYLYEDVAASGALLSEYAPGTEPLGRNFPVRNRILSGLSIAVVVVEAPEHSGALITAETALEQGRDVYAVPGNADAVNSQGCHQLLREGAGLAVSSWDVLNAYQGRFPGKLRNLQYPMPKTLGYQQRTAAAVPEKKPPEQKPLSLPVVDLEKNPLGLTDDQIMILRCLDSSEPMQVDEIIQQTQIPARRTMSALTMLEIESLVSQSAGKCFVRTVAVTGKESVHGE